MANRRQKKNSSRVIKNRAENENRSDPRCELKNKGKKDRLPKESSDFTVKSMKRERKITSLSDSQSKMVQIIEKGVFGRKPEAPFKENKNRIIHERMIDRISENWKGKRYSRNRVQKFRVLPSTITKKNSKSIILREINILRKDFRQSIRMDKFFSFNKINIERLSCFFHQNITIRNLNLNETVLRSKSLKSPLSNVIFENIIKKDGFTLLNKEMGLTYSISFKNANPRSISQENIYFTLNCIECNNSVFICQSLDALFSFKTSKYKRCETYKNQQNYLSLIYNGCFFPNLKIKNCHKCSSVKVDDNPKILNCPLMERSENLSKTTSSSQSSSSIRLKDLNLLSSEKDFTKQKFQNYINYDFIAWLNNCHPIIPENNSNNLHEQKVFEGNIEQGSTISSFEPSDLSASPDCQKCSCSLLRNSNSACNSSYIEEPIQISDPSRVISNFSPVLSNTYDNNCMRYINCAFIDVPVVDNQNVSEGYYNDTFLPAEATPNVEVGADLTNSNLCCSYAGFPDTKTKSYGIDNDGWENNQSSFCRSNSRNYVSDIYSSNTHNPLRPEWTNSNEIGCSYGTNTYSDILNETDKNNIFKFPNQERNKLSYKYCEECLYNPEYISPKHISRFYSKNSVTSYSNFCSYSNQMFTGVANHCSCLNCSNYERKFKNWNNSQGFISSHKNSYGDIGNLSNTFVPISYSNDRETTVSEGKTQNNIDFNYLHDYNEIDFVNGRNSLVSDTCLSLETNEKIDYMNSNRKEVQMSTNNYDQHNSISEYEFPANDLNNFNVSSLKPNNNYNTNYLNFSGNIAYNICSRTPRENVNSNYPAQVLSSNLKNSGNFSIYGKAKYSSGSSYRNTCDSFHTSNSCFPNEFKFSSRQYTKPKGNYFNNGIDYPKRLHRNYGSLNFNRRNGASRKSFNYNNHKNRHFSESSFGSSLEFSKNFHGKNFQKYRKQESCFSSYRNQLKLTVSPSKPKFFNSNYNKGNFSRFGYECKSIYREVFNPQEEFFNAAANPNSYV